MGFRNLIETGQTTAAPVWKEYRHQFPVTERFIYLNHAAVAPLSLPAADAMRSLTNDVLSYGSFHYSQWLDAYQGLRDSAARMIGADPSEIAVVKNTSEGIATIALGIDWRAGDKVIGFREEFPANSLPWSRLEAKGVRVEWLSVTDPLDRIDQACQGARLLAISFVNFLSGFRVDLNAIGEICKRRGCFFFVDAIQGMGAFPLDVEINRIDALAADGHKWMLGPEGCGILYVRKDRQEQIQPAEFGWTNVAHFNNYASRDMTLRPDAGRYECGTLNTVGCFGLAASIRLLLEVGIPRIAVQVQGLADRIAAGGERKGYEVLGHRTPETGAGIVAFRKAGTDCREVVNKLERAGIIAAPRQGWVRMSPHFYISPEEIDRMLEELP
ncbi:MAG: aminotransferase class V-fold PLP-dependent enzyme [Acidobacteriota bacterium]|nr:aminotransferase class V-fold PLP-dependent enzyme [Acidobacteriota bacterium]